jgi:membrane-bound lytic murein transglycosylase A
MIIMSVLSAQTMAGKSALRPVDFDQLTGWPADNHLDAFHAFLKTCRVSVAKPPKHKPLTPDTVNFQNICKKALGLKNPDNRHARLFFETWFRPYLINKNGLLTGYFEPRHLGSRTKTQRFRYPLYKKPDALKPIKNRKPENLDHVTWAYFENGQWREAPDRRSMDEGALDGQGLELVWLESKIDAFFIHIQGSAAFTLTDGTEMKIGFNGKSGHAYTPIGKILVDRGIMRLEDVSMDSLKRWLSENPDRADEIMQQNRSFIFFEERKTGAADEGPVAAAGVPLTAGRSLAIDRQLYAFGYPFWLQSDISLPESKEKSLQRLVIAQDTGSAITGKARGDLYIGSGAQAGHIAGQMAMKTDFYILLPKPSSEGLSP